MINWLIGYCVSYRLSVNCYYSIMIQQGWRRELPGGGRRWGGGRGGAGGGAGGPRAGGGGRGGSRKWRQVRSRCKSYEITR